MRLYADASARRARQVAADLFVLDWTVAWVLVGRWVFDLVLTLARPAVPLRSAGTGLSERMEDIAGRIGQVPLVGDELDAPFTGAAGVGDDLVSAGDQLEASVGAVAWVVSLLSAGTPVLLVLLAWALLRLSWVRRAASLGREVSDPESQQLLALRALVRQHPRRLQEIHPDPVAAFRSGDPELLRRLADLELTQVGLRTRP